MAAISLQPRVQPTLWRMCRVLANGTRLQLLAQLVRKPNQSVSQLAESCSLTLPVASQSLRALESRGLLRARRIRRRVEYRLPIGAEAGALADLVAALQNTLRSTPVPVDYVMKLATAFTHPARVEICRALRVAPKSKIEIQVVIRLSFPAVTRHLAKLVARGFVYLDEASGRYAQTTHPHAVGVALTRLAVL